MRTVACVAAIAAAAAISSIVAIFTFRRKPVFGEVVPKLCLGQPQKYAVGCRRLNVGALVANDGVMVNELAQITEAEVTIFPGEENERVPAVVQLRGRAEADRVRCAEEQEHLRVLEELKSIFAGHGVFLHHPLDDVLVAERFHRSPRGFPLEAQPRLVGLIAEQ